MALPGARSGSRPRWRWVRRTVQLVGAGAALAVLGVAASALWAFTVLPRSLPPVTGLEGIRPGEGSRLYDDDDELLAELQAERRIFLPLAEIPQVFRDAVLAVEDSRFYSHSGVDPVGLVRAVFQNVRRGRVVEGGSTITQQLAKRLFLTPDKNLDRKLREAVLAVELERRYPKDRILEMYLNQVYFGHGAYGVVASARTFFGKSVPALTLPEAALLAGLPRAPSIYSPFNHAEAARRRRAHVLNRMLEVGALAPDDARRAMAAPLGLIPAGRRRRTGRYFTDYVRELLEETYGEDMVFKRGLKVYTTLSRRLQALAERSMRDGLRELASRRVAAPVDKGPRPAGERPEGALVSIEPHTGYIRAMVGGSDFSRTEFNRAVQAKRQPGSAFKPFVYIAALEAGLTPATRIDDSPVVYPVGGKGRPWEPENYDRNFRGPVTLQQGVEESINVVTVKLQERIGLRRTISVARRLGIQSPLQANLTLALGSSELSLLELTSAYGALANRGVWVRPTPVRYVTDAGGRLLEESIPEDVTALSPEVAYLITHMLEGVVERGTGIGAKVLGRPIAAKTGTTNDYSNAWFVGYTPSIVTGVWVGYDRPRSLGEDETGARVAVPVWVSYMSRVLANTPWDDFSPPEGVVIVPVDLEAAAVCARPVPMAFLRGTEPQRSCPHVADRAMELPEGILP